MKTILIIITLLIVFSIVFIIIKYFLLPLFFKPKLNLIEAIEFFEKENLKFVDKRELNLVEKKLNPFNFKKGFSIKNIYSMRTEYVVVGFSESEKEYHFFWLEITQWFIFYMKFILEFLSGEKIDHPRNLFFKEITETEVVKNLKENYKKTINIIKDKCPACQSSISEKANECPKCGLNLKAN
jgi:hypothetical protein